jgi:hypothetical protein
VHAVRDHGKPRLHGYDQTAAWNPSLFDEHVVEHQLTAWHNYLKESRQGGYAWGRNIRLPKIMQRALESAEWRDAVQRLSAS